MIFNTIKRNTPVATLIKNFVNKKSGKVAVSRNEIHRRFEYLDWKDQKKILKASLDSCKSDRCWAYRNLLKYWDKSFEPKIKEVWDIFHDPMCSWPIIRFFPTSYIKEHMNSFTDIRDFYFISIRFAEDPNYVIEKDKLSKAEYLGVLYHSGRTISSEEANDILYEIVHDLCVEGLSYNEIEDIKYTEGRISPNNFRSIYYSKYYLEEMNYSQVVLIFEDWVEKVQKLILESADYKAIMNWDNSYNNVELGIMLLRKYSYRALDSKYKLPTDTYIDDFLKSIDWSLLWRPSAISKKNIIPQKEEQRPPSDPEYIEKMQDMEELPF